MKVGGTAGRRIRRRENAKSSGRLLGSRSPIRTAARGRKGKTRNEGGNRRRETGKVREEGGRASVPGGVEPRKHKKKEREVGSGRKRGGGGWGGRFVEAVG